MFGVKVVGGKMTEDGKLAAFITEVAKGSPADRDVHLQPGVTLCGIVAFV